MVRTKAPMIAVGVAPTSWTEMVIRQAVVHIAETDCSIVASRISIIVFFHFTYLSCLFAGILPTGKKFIHQSMETGIVAGFQ
jgi:hypothetical protein